LDAVLVAELEDLLELVVEVTLELVEDLLELELEVLDLELEDEVGVVEIETEHSLTPPEMRLPKVASEQTKLPDNTL
jgi:hypothetical protein